MMKCNATNCYVGWEMEPKYHYDVTINANPVVTIYPLDLVKDLFYEIEVYL